MGMVMGMIMDPFTATSFYSTIVEVEKQQQNAPICLSHLCGGCGIMNMSMVVDVGLG